MAYAFGFPRDVTELIDSMWDWRYRLVRGGGKTPSASAMPFPVPPHAGYEPVCVNMEHGQFYINRVEYYSEYYSDPWGMFAQPPDCVRIDIWDCYKSKHPWDSDHRMLGPIKSFECSSEDAHPRDLAALWYTCDACESEL